MLFTTKELIMICNIISVFMSNIGRMAVKFGGEFNLAIDNIYIYSIHVCYIIQDLADWWIRERSTKLNSANMFA